jgi:hypothetical protein
MEYSFEEARELFPLIPIKVLEAFYRYEEDGYEAGHFV